MSETQGEHCGNLRIVAEQPLEGFIPVEKCPDPPSTIHSHIFSHTIGDFRTRDSGDFDSWSGFLRDFFSNLEPIHTGWVSSYVCDINERSIFASLVALLPDKLNQAFEIREPVRARDIYENCVLLFRNADFNIRETNRIHVFIITQEKFTAAEFQVLQLKSEASDIMKWPAGKLCFHFCAAKNHRKLWSLASTSIFFAGWLRLR